MLHVSVFISYSPLLDNVECKIKNIYILIFISCYILLESWGMWNEYGFIHLLPVSSSGPHPYNHTFNLPPPSTDSLLWATIQTYLWYRTVAVRDSLIYSQCWNAACERTCYSIALLIMLPYIISVRATQSLFITRIILTTCDQWYSSPSRVIY